MDDFPGDDLAAAAAPVALAERVADQLRDLVVRGVLAPGQRIVERRLCAELGVSRTPMREALKLLRQDGLVEISCNCGARVTPHDACDAIDLFETIGALEAAAARARRARSTPPVSPGSRRCMRRWRRSMTRDGSTPILR